MDYADLLKVYPEPISMLLLFLLGFARMAPIVQSAPFFGAKALPVTIKVLFATSLTVIFLPQLVHVTTKPLQFDVVFLAMAVKEVFIGLVIGFLVSVPFSIAASSGTLIDHQRGASSLMITDPTMQIQASPIGLLYNYTLIVVFYAIGGAILFFDAVSLSFNVIPPDRFISPTFFNIHNVFWRGMISLANDIVRIASQLAAPALVAMFMTDIFTGIANRLAQQVPMSFLLWALKSLVGIGILWAAWQFIIPQLGIETKLWLQHMVRMIESVPAIS